MSDTLTSAELNSLQLELLPARTVLSLFTLGTEGTNGQNGSDSVGTPQMNILGVPLGLPPLGK